MGDAVAWLYALGLSLQRNFDKAGEAPSEVEPGYCKLVPRYGLKGITSYGARRVRCAAHLLEKTHGKHRVAFATCTLPSLPAGEMRRLHESWGVVVDAYRRKVRRILRENGLSGETVCVFEIQEQRYKDTDIPALHIHSVFCNKTRSGQWVIRPKDHDEIWRSSLSIALGRDVPKLGSACNIQRVQKSSEGYLGKYLSKGSKVVTKILEDGLGRWLPKQWWAVSRDLGRRVDEETRDVSDIAEWLNDIAGVEGSNVWIYHVDISIESEVFGKIIVAKYGRLTNRYLAELRYAFRGKKISQIAY